MSEKVKKDTSKKKKRIIIISGITMGIAGLFAVIGIAALLILMPTPDTIRVEKYLENKYGIDFEVEKITDYGSKVTEYDNLYFCHPVEDESIQFCVYDVDGKIEENFLGTVVVEKLKKELEEDFAELGIDATIECTMGNYADLTGEFPWNNDNNYQMELEEFLNKYSEENQFLCYIVIRKSDIVNETGKPDLELLRDLASKYSDIISSDVCFQMLFASDEMYERFDMVFTECPMVTRYKGYGYTQTILHSITMIVENETKEPIRPMESYYKDYGWREDWEDEIILLE